MATANGPDLDPARRAVEALMDDTCVITLDAGGIHDDVLDEETGKLVSPDHVTLYDSATLGHEGRELNGMCAVSVSDARPVFGQPGGGVEFVQQYTLKLPWDAPEIPEGASVEIVTSRRDPLLPGREFTVNGIHFGTMLVQRRLPLEKRREPQYAEPGEDD